MECYADSDTSTRKLLGEVRNGTAPDMQMVGDTSIIQAVNQPLNTKLYANQIVVDLSDEFGDNVRSLIDVCRQHYKIRLHSRYIGFDRILAFLLVSVACLFRLLY